MNNALGDRIKNNYENRFQFSLPRRSYTILRLDGKNFKTYTRKLNKPFDMRLIEDFTEVVKYLCQNIQGAKMGYYQSDEISILLTDFDDITTDAWFDNNIQKMCSISASMVTAKFNQLRPGIIALFDSRVFQISDRIEVENYFINRQKDCTRNSISAAAQALYSTKELSGKNSDFKQEMIFQKGINWNDYPVSCKRGQIIIKESYQKDNSTRTRWISVDPPIFTKDRTFLNKLIPVMEHSSITPDYVPIM